MVNLTFFKLPQYQWLEIATFNILHHRCKLGGASEGDCPPLNKLKKAMPPQIFDINLIFF